MQQRFARATAILLAALGFAACTDAPTSTATADDSPAGSPSAALIGAPSPRILIYNNEPAGGDLAVKNQILAATLGAGTDIDVLQMTSPPPPLNTLLAYGCVLVYTTQPPIDPVAQGNRLKEYADAGGGVVLASGVYADAVFTLQGGIMGNGYSPLDNTGNHHTVFARNLNFATAMTSHPLLAGVSSYTYQTSTGFVDVTLDPGATLVASDNFGIPLLAVNAAGNIAGIVTFPSLALPANAGVYQTFANACSSVGFRPGGLIRGFGSLDIPAGSLIATPMYSDAASLNFVADQIGGVKIPQGVFTIAMPGLVVQGQNIISVRTRFFSGGATGVMQGSGVCTGGNCNYRVTVFDAQALGTSLKVKTRDAIRVEVWRRNQNGTSGPLLLDTGTGAGFGVATGVFQGSALITQR